MTTHTPLFSGFFNMRNNYETALQLVLKSEGGYVNDSRDRGGATNRGVTQSTYDAYRLSVGRAPKSVKHISEQEVASIYRRDYAMPIKFDELPAGLDYAMFDFAINSGVARAAKTLQEVVGVGQDGIIGSKTLAACLAHTQVRGVITDLCDARQSFVETLSNYDAFCNGWTNRINDVRRVALKMANGTRIFEGINFLTHGIGKAYAN